MLIVSRKEPTPRVHRLRKISLLALLIALINSCKSASFWDDSEFRYDTESFTAVVRERAPDQDPDLYNAPFILTNRTKALARRKLTAAPTGANPIMELVALLSDPKPKGLDLEYDWSTSGNAKLTLERGKGDCVALAIVLVGLGRSLNWPMYFAEARAATPVVHEFEEVTVLSGHMVVVALSRSGIVIIDFLGLVDTDDYDIQPIDDVTAYAHLINNIAGQQVINEATDHSPNAWATAQAGFELATKIQPNLGRAWNNLGIAYARSGRIEEARSAYTRAVELNNIYGSPARNLTIMETRALRGTTLLDGEFPK